MVERKAKNRKSAAKSHDKKIQKFSDIIGSLFPCKTAIMFKREKTKNLKSSAKLCDKTIQKLSKIIVQHIALKEEKREQQSPLDQLDKKKNIIEFIISLKLLNQY